MHTSLITYWLAEKTDFLPPRPTLFPMGPVIMPEPLLWLVKYFLQFEGTRPNHMWVNFIHPRKIFSFDKWHLMCSHPIRKHIHNNGTNFLKHFSVQKKNKNNYLITNKGNLTCNWWFLQGQFWISLCFLPPLACSQGLNKSLAMPVTTYWPTTYKAVCPLAMLSFATCR